MKIVKEYKQKEFVYDNLAKDSSKQILKLDEEELLFDFKNLIDSQFTGGNVDGNFEKLKDFLNLGMYSKAPCGGFVNFYRLKGKNNFFVIYSGVNEVSNSHYVVTIHKILIL